MDPLFLRGKQDGNERCLSLEKEGFFLLEKMDCN